MFALGKPLTQNVFTSLMKKTMDLFEIRALDLLLLLQITGISFKFIQLPVLYFHTDISRYQVTKKTSAENDNLGQIMRLD